MHNQFSGVRFERTQPREWRDTPFDGERDLLRAVMRAVVGTLIYAAVLAVSLWSIAQQAQP